MITAAFDLALWTVFFFIIGMIKPQWPLFFMKKPDRLIILAITAVFIMATFTLWGEGNRRAKAENEIKPPVTQSTVPVPVPTPTVAPTPPSAPVPAAK